MLLVDIKVWLFYCRSVLVDDDVAVIFVSVCYNHLWQAYVTKILWIVKNNWLKIHERIYFSETRHTSIMSSNLNTNSFLLYSLISFQMFKKINFFKSVNILLALGSLPIFFCAQWAVWITVEKWSITIVLLRDVYIISTDNNILGTFYFSSIIIFFFCSFIIRFYSIQFLVLFSNFFPLIFYIIQSVNSRIKNWHVL